MQTTASEMIYSLYDGREPGRAGREQEKMAGSKGWWAGSQGIWARGREKEDGLGAR